MESSPNAVEDTTEFSQDMESSNGTEGTPECNEIYASGKCSHTIKVIEKPCTTYINDKEITEKKIPKK